MPRKKTSKQVSSLEITFKDVLVCQKNSLKPYIEIFTQQPENITQQKLGFLAGILEITDTSPDSSYIVNYLVSIIKKEYYRQTKRGAMESFEACLHKANLALAKLAEHENINWLGKLNAVIIAIEKNNLYLAQTGNAQALFLRDNTLKNINEDTPADVSPLTPLKTFTDIISGRINKNDQLILTTNNLFDIVSLAEIKRNILKFSSSEFIQFLKTALTNELDQSAVLIIKAQEKIKIKETAKIVEKEKPLNAFSQASFTNHCHKKPLKNKEKKDIIEEANNNLKKKSRDFVDEKTGHIYIKESNISPKNSFSLANFLHSLQEKAINLKLLTQKTLLPKLKQLFFFFSKSTTTSIKQNKQRLIRITQIQRKNFFSQSSKISKKVLLFSSSILICFQKILYQFFKKHSLKKPASFFHFQILPKFSRLKKTFFHLNRQQKYIAISALIALLVIPYLLVKLPNKNNESIQLDSKNSHSSIPPLYQDKNVIRIKKTTTVTLQNNISHIINLNSHIFIIHPTSITDLNNKKSYSLPSNFGKVALACPMDDLNLIFLLNKQQLLLTWSPITKKFQTNQINIPSQANIISLKSYLTYLYFLDVNNNQIYRYPRATGGFGDKVNWLKENTNLSKVSSMTINDNIFLAQKNKLIKFYRGKKQSFQLEKTATPIQINGLYSQPNSQNIYLLDNANSRIVKLDLNGHIVNQYYNPQIKKATTFTVDKKAQLIYFVVANNVESFKM